MPDSPSTTPLPATAAIAGDPPGGAGTRSRGRSLPPALPPIREGVKVSWVRLRPDRRLIDHELIWLCILPLTGVLGLAWWKSGLPLPQCNLKRLTGLPCVSCGATRSVQLIWDRFDFLGAFLLNPLVFALYALGGVFVLYAAVVITFRLPRFRIQVAGRAAHRLRFTLLVVILLNWAYVMAMDV